MDNANKFFERLGNNILNEVHTTVEGIIENKKGNLYDVKANGLPLLINLPTLTIKSKGKSIKNDLDKGDRVLVAFSKSNLSDGYIIGSIDEDSIDLVDFIQGQLEDLETKEKVIVDAINEVNQKFNSIPEVDKPMVLTGTILPSASQTYRGVIFTVLGNEDIPYICLKNGSKYEWQRLLGGCI